MLWWTLFIVIVIYIFIKLRKPTRYWKDRGVTSITPLIFFGDMLKNFIRKKALHELVEEYYNTYPNAKYCGLLQFSSPILMLRDPELIKRITVKDFDSFMNHRVVLTEDNEPLFGKNLLSLKGQKWKNMRSTLSPAFTSSKMRAMFSLITECSKQFVDYFSKEVENKNGIITTVEMKDIFTRYTTDVIATAAFGITCDSLKEKENEFYMAGKNSTTFGGFALLKIIAFVVIPRFCKMIGMTVIDKKITNFFRKLILSTMKVREEQNIIRPDMIHLLMQAKKGQLKHEAIIEDAGFATVQESNIGKIQEINKPALTDDDIIAQAFLFLFAGYDTASTMMSFMAYEVAINPDVQKKLQNEIDEVENFDYETVLKMKYLDMVVSESLRKWPPAALTERLCEKPYLIDTPNDNEAPLLVEKDVSIWIPVYSIQRDPKYFPDPERFDPERFSDENKHNINPFTYLPFGQGPRNCIGSRFALLEIKILFVHLLKIFDFIVVEKTQIPLKFNPKVFNMTAENGIWLGLKARN